MFFSLESGLGLDVVLWLQSYGNGFFDAIASFLHILGGSIGYLVLLPIIYWSVNRQLGRQLLIVLTLVLFLLIESKVLFGRPRPFEFAPDDVRAVVFSEGFGFPSGHVGLATALWGYIVFYYLTPKNRWLIGVLGAYILLVAWARMYGGVHYPQDVIGGFIIGAAVVVFLRMYIYQLDALWANLPVPVEALLIVAAGVITGYLLRGDPSGLSCAGIIIGGGLGTMLMHRQARFSAGGPTTQRAIRYVTGVVLTMIVFVALDVAFEPLQPAAVFRVLRYSLVTFVILGLYPVLMLRFHLSETESVESQPAEAS